MPKKLLGLRILAENFLHGKIWIKILVFKFQVPMNPLDVSDENAFQIIVSDIKFCYRLLLLLFTIL